MDNKEEFIEYCDKCGKKLDQLKNEDIFIEGTSEVFCAECYCELELRGIMGNFERIKGEKGEY